MIGDARTAPPEEGLECDVCIVGAGPAGLSVALELSGAGARVLVLEAGGWSYDRGAQALYEGEVLGDSYPRLRETRFSAFGGSTQLWAGWCRPLDPIDFETRPWVPESGWPFGYEELLPCYERAHELCGLAEFVYDPSYWEKRLGHERFPVEGGDLRTSMFHVSPSRFGETYRRRFEDLRDVDVLLHAPVLRLHSAATSDQVEALSAATLDGRRFRVRAGTFVLATGGIENARLLLLSGDSPERSIGNGRGLVGRYFTEHAFIHPGTFVPSDPDRSPAFYFPMPVGDPPGAAVRATFSLSRAAVQREELLNAAVFFRPAYEAHPAFETDEVQSLLDAWEKLRGRGVPGGMWSKLSRAARNPTALSVAIWRKLTVPRDVGDRWPLRAFFESEPSANNDVRLLRDRHDALGRPLPSVRWRIGEADLRGVRRTFHALDHALRESGVGHLELAFRDDPEAWRAAAVGGKHHMGTTRMHESPERGVVDADGRVHGVSNLYVAGSSVFPTVGFANPTLTIVALAVRLGRHLRRRLDRVD